MAPLRLRTRRPLMDQRVRSTAEAAAVNFLTTLSVMDWAYHAEPFVVGPTKVTTDLQTMNYAYIGEPFVRYRK